MLQGSLVTWDVIVSEQLAAVPEFATIGALFKSSHLPVELTESETEYMVQCVKHTFTNYIVFQVSLFLVNLLLT